MPAVIKIDNNLYKVFAEKIYIADDHGNVFDVMYVKYIDPQFGRMHHHVCDIDTGLPVASEGKSKKDAIHKAKVSLLGYGYKLYISCKVGFETVGNVPGISPNEIWNFAKLTIEA